MNECTITLTGHNQCKLVTDDFHRFKIFQEKFHTTQWRPDRWKKFRPTVVSPISPTGGFKLGLFRDVYMVAKEIFETVYVNNCITKKLIPLHALGYHNCILSVTAKKFVYFKEQLVALEKLLQLGRGIVVSPCASGKSLIIAGLCWNLYNKLPRAKFESILLIVPTRQLVTQMYKDFVEYGLGNITQEFTSGATTIQKNCAIIISNRQWLALHSEELPTTSIVIADECQSLASNNKVTEYVNSLQTDLRFGFTATLPSDKYEYHEIKGVIGPVIAKYNYQDMSENRNIVPVNMTSVLFKFNTALPQIKQLYDVTEREKFDNLRVKYDREYEFFLNSNKVMISLLNFVGSLQGNTLFLFDYLKIRDLIREHYLEIPDIIEGKICHFIDGSIPINTREEIRTELSKNKNIIVFAQAQTMGVGINVPNLDNVVLFFVTKSPVKTIQAVGRAMRSFTNKTSANIYDVSSNLRYSRKHFSERQKHYLQNFGKQITIEKVLHS